MLTSCARLAVEPAGFCRPAEALFAAVQDRRGCFFLDSALSSGGLGAHSFFGFEPFLVARAAGDRIELFWEGSDRPEVRRGDPFSELRRLLEARRTESCDALPFCGGAVGYFSYEWGSEREGVRPAGGAGAGPDFEFAFYDGVVAVEAGTNEVRLVANAVHRDGTEAILARLRRSLDEALARPPVEERFAGPPVEIHESLPREAYLRAVERIRRYIAAGDVYQVNLTQRFEAALTDSPYALYRRLRRLSPAPFGCFIDLGGTGIAGSSPERFLRVRGRRAETRPIKGTRPRGRTAAEDEALGRALGASAKDRAELLMIVDLERNDLGRVCEFGSVEVEDNFRLESHPTVHHLVGQVAGRLRPEVDALGCVAALFPGGSITGAPKIRAMQIIAELETCPRHAYTGAAGYLGYDGGCDFNISIRSFFLRGGRVCYHAGGGVVWDSEPEAEHAEMLAKAGALGAALRGGEAGA